MDSKAFHICPFCHAQSPVTAARCASCGRSLEGLPLPVYGADLDAGLARPAAPLVDLPLREGETVRTPEDAAPARPLVETPARPPVARARPSRTVPERWSRTLPARSPRLATLAGMGAALAVATVASIAIVHGGRPAQAKRAPGRMAAREAPTTLATRPAEPGPVTSANNRSTPHDPELRADWRREASATIPPHAADAPPATRSVAQPPAARSSAPPPVVRATATAPGPPSPSAPVVRATPPPPAPVARPSAPPAVRAAPPQAPAVQVYTVHPDVRADTADLPDAASAPPDVRRAREPIRRAPPSDEDTSRPDIDQGDGGARDAAALRAQLGRAIETRDRLADRVDRLRARVNVPVVKDVDEYQRLQAELETAREDLDRANLDVARWQRALRRAQ